MQVVVWEAGHRMARSPTDDNFALVRYDVDRIEREIAGVRGRFDGVHARLTELQRDISTVRTMCTALQHDVTSLVKMVAESNALAHETLSQVRVAQEQQGRMLREIDELRKKEA